MSGSMSSLLHKLTEQLREFPGIGPRQARRLALWLVKKDSAWITELFKTLVESRKSVHSCSLCMRMFEPALPNITTCDVCVGASRDGGTLMLVEKDVDMENIERTGTYKGHYFILGGTTSLLDKEPERFVRIKELIVRLIDKEHPVEELIYALSATTEGEDTEAYVRERLASQVEKLKIRVSVLGRGLSTGTELEYIDADTMKSALAGRHSA